MAQCDLSVQHLVAAQEIVAPEHSRDGLLARSRDAPEGHRALGRQQVAMLPAELEADALAGAVARLAGDGAHRRRLDRDGEVDEVAALARHRPDRNGRDQPGCDQGLAKILDPRGAIRLALAKAGDGFEMARAEQGRAFDHDPAEPPSPRRPDRQDQGGGAGVMIDLDLGRADFGEGIAARAERRPERRLGLADLGGVDRLVDADAERLAKGRRVRPGRLFEPRQADLGETVDRPRLDAERHQEGARPRRVDRGAHRRVEIAEGTEQLAEQFAVGAGAAVDLGGVGRLLAILLKRRKRAELDEHGRHVLIVEALDPVAIGPRGGRVGDIGVGQIGDDVALLGLHVRPVDAEIGPGLQRRRGIERLAHLVERVGLRARLIRRLRRGSGRTEDEGKNGRQGGRAPPRNGLQHAKDASRRRAGAPERK